MLTITKRPTAKNQGKETFCLNAEEMTRVQMATKEFPVKIEVYDLDNELIKSIPRSKFKKLEVTPKRNSYDGESYYLVDYSNC